MIRRITLDNFMSHVHSVIDLDAGLNVLVGPNNCGKSAVVEAIRAVCENTQTDFMVRHGAKEASVTVETDDGHTIVWRRRKTYASYTLNGEQNDRPTDDYLQRVHALLRLPTVSASDGSEFQIHLGLQKSPIFLLNESRLRQATFFASSSDADKLLDMQRLHRSRVSENKKAHARLSLEIANLDAKLAPLEKLNPLVAETSELSRQFDACQQFAAQVEQLERTILQLRHAQHDHGEQSARLRALTKLSTPPSFQDEIALQRIIRQFGETERTRNRASAKQGVVRMLSSPPVLNDVRLMETAIDRLRAASATKRRVAAVAGHLTQLCSPPELTDDAAVRLSAVTLKSAATAVAVAMRSTASANKELSVLKIKTVAFVRDHPNCPLCNGPLDADRLLTVGGHEHG